MNTTYQIRKAESTDFDAILGLIKELALFEKAPEKVTNTVAQMQSEQQYFRCFVVEHQGEVVAMALYFMAYFTWVGKSLYLDDLYVKPEHRKQGIGQALLSRLFQIAQEENCSRVRWQVLDWNKPAVALYKKIGSELDYNWVNCDFDREGIAQFHIKS